LDSQRKCDIKERRSFREALAEAIREARLELKPLPQPERPSRRRRGSPPPPRGSYEARMSFRDGLWYVDGQPYRNYRQALHKALEAADCGPQRGNSEGANRPRDAKALAAGGGL
jgi:hypothetical protein